MSSVTAAVLHGPRSLAIERGAVGAPAPDEVRVHVTAAGLCGTDYRIWTGERPVAYPRIMGHEFVGRVAAVGERVDSLAIDERVVVEPNYSCGHCPLCREGNRNLCLSRTAIGIDVDGGFAEEACVPARCCWRIPPGVSDLEAMVTEPLAVVVRAVDRGGSAARRGRHRGRRGQSGPARDAGAAGAGGRVLVVARTPARPLARRLGADAVHAGAEGPLEAAARAFSGREGVDLVVETAGTPAAVAHALELVRPGGRVVLTGLPHSRRRSHSSRSSAGK